MQNKQLGERLFALQKPLFCKDKHAMSSPSYHATTTSQARTPIIALPSFAFAVFQHRTTGPIRSRDRTTDHKILSGAGDLPSNLKRGVGVQSAPAGNQQQITSSTGTMTDQNISGGA